jgi:hypothetical protein
MSEHEKIIVHAFEIAKRIRERLAASHSDREFDAVRADAGLLIQELASDFSNSVTVQKIIDCVRKFENLEVRKLSKTQIERSVVNQSVLSSRIKSTHYSAFIAGKYGESDQIGSKFKCWIYNTAAHGAIETAALIDRLLHGLKKASVSDIVDLAKLFRSSAISDASRFLEFARKHDENSALRIFNSSRIDIISTFPDQIRFGIKRLGEIEPPADNCEAADICWHEDNWSHFQHDHMLREIIHREAAHEFQILSSTLEKNYNKACRIREQRGDIWKIEHKRNNATIASFGAVMLAVGSYAYANPSTITDAYHFSKDLFEYMQTIFASAIDPQSQFLEARVGDGGLANPLRFARAIFGDGGLA